jgi:hypothetical protein
MRIYEVKNNTAEILYSLEDSNLFLSDFLYIEDEELTIIAQVTNITSTDSANINVATVKFYLSVDRNNRLTKYNGHTPTKNAEVGVIEANEIISLFKPKENSILWGNYVRQNELTVETDINFLTSNFCTICDKSEQREAIAKTITKSLEKNNARILIMDFDGKYKNINTSKKATFGVDYRIPLDSKALNYIFENDLDECPLDAKINIQNIILEIQKYIESIEKHFIPFELFLQIIFSEATRTKSPALLTFSNKLLKYKYKKVFADKESQFAMINLCNSSFKLDLSDTDESLYPLIFSSVLSRISKKFYVLSDITENNVKNSTIKNLYEKQNICFIPQIGHNNIFLNKIKSYCNNFAIFAPIEQIPIKEDYSNFLERLLPNEYILWGENLLFVPLIVSLEKGSRTNQLQISEKDKISISDLDELDKINIETVKHLLAVEQKKKKEEEIAKIKAQENKEKEKFHIEDNFITQPMYFKLPKNTQQNQPIVANSTQQSQQSQQIQPIQQIYKTEQQNQIAQEIANENVMQVNTVEEINVQTNPIINKRILTEEQPIEISKNTEIVVNEKLDNNENIIVQQKEINNDFEEAEENILDNNEDTEDIEDNQQTTNNNIEPLQEEEILAVDNDKEDEEDPEENTEEETVINTETENHDEEDEEEDANIDSEIEEDDEEDNEEVVSDYEEAVIIEEEDEEDNTANVVQEEDEDENDEDEEGIIIEESNQKNTEKEQQIESKPIEIKVQKQVAEEEKVERRMPNANSLPIYEPKEGIANKESEGYAEGCRVSHAQYGQGTVDKIIKYGRKTMLYIDFDKGYRKLLDPNITTIEKM